MNNLSNEDTHTELNNEYDYYIKEFRDICPNFDIIPVIIPHKHRIIAIGDIHGDMESAIKLLLVGNLIEEVDQTMFNNPIKQIYYKINNNILIREKKILKIKDACEFIINDYSTVYRYYKYNNKYYVKVNINNQIKWFKWIGKDTYVVQVGDQIDRCRPFDTKCMHAQIDNDENSDLEIMLLYDSLDKIAKKNKGRVFSLLGNHEMMNVLGDLRYVSKKGILDFSLNKNIKNGIATRKKVFKNIIAKKMACTRATILIIGEYLFVHAGIIAELAEKYKLTEVNSVIRNFLNNFSGNKKDIDFIINSSSTSPLWYRGLGFIYPDNYKYDERCKTLFDNVIQKINDNNIESVQIKGMVIGHTPQFLLKESINGITSACKGKLHRVDIGISKAFDNIVSLDDINIKNARKASVLEIITDLETYKSYTNILYLKKN